MASTPIKKTEPAPEKHSLFAFTRINFVLLGIGMLIIVLGYALMSGTGSDATTFNPEIFSARRIKVAPMVCLFGYLFIIVAILYRPRKKQTE